MAGSATTHGNGLQPHALQPGDTFSVPVNATHTVLYKGQVFKMVNGEAVVTAANDPIAGVSAQYKAANSGGRLKAWRNDIIFEIADNVAGNDGLASGLYDITDNDLLTGSATTGYSYGTVDLQASTNDDLFVIGAVPAVDNVAGTAHFMKYLVVIYRANRQI